MKFFFVFCLIACTQCALPEETPSRISPHRRAWCERAPVEALDRLRRSGGGYRGYDYDVAELRDRLSQCGLTLESIGSSEGELRILPSFLAVKEKFECITATFPLYEKVRQGMLTGNPYGDADERYTQPLCLLRDALRCGGMTFADIEPNKEVRKKIELVWTKESARRQDAINKSPLWNTGIPCPPWPAPEICWSTK